MKLPHERAGATPGDVMVFLAMLSLAAALLYPAWSTRDFRDRVERATADVAAVESAARSALALSGAWPPPAPPGQAPIQMVGLTGEGRPFGRTDYALQWTTWNVVDSVEVASDAAVTPGDLPPDSVGPQLSPVVRSIGGVTVHSGDAALLAELATQYAEQLSFVLDTTWVLLLPERASVAARTP
jgi:hypothetical protein